MQSGEETDDEAQMECARMLQFKAGLIPLGMGKVCMRCVTQCGAQRNPRCGWVSGEEKKYGGRYRQKERWETMANILLVVSIRCFISPHNQTSRGVKACICPV